VIFLLGRPYAPRYLMNLRKYKVSYEYFREFFLCSVCVRRDPKKVRVIENVSRDSTKLGRSVIDACSFLTTRF